MPSRADSQPPARSTADVTEVSLREALVALDNLIRLSSHLWHHVDVPLRLVEAMRTDLEHLGRHLRRAAGLHPPAQR